MEKGWMPRNLNQSDIIKLGFGIKLKFSDLPFLSGGGLISYLCNAGSGNTVVTVLSSAVIIASSYAISKISHEGQESSELIKNTVVYTTKKIMYKKEKEVNEVKNDKINESKLYQYFIQKRNGAINDIRKLWQNAPFNGHSNTNFKLKSNIKCK